MNHEQRTTISGGVVWLDDTSAPPVAMLTTKRGPIRAILRDEHVGDVRAIVGNAGRCLRVRGDIVGDAPPTVAVEDYRVHDAAALRLPEDTPVGWSTRPTFDGYWWMRDGAKDPEVVKVEMWTWKPPHFVFYRAGSEVEIYSWEMGSVEPVLWQPVLPAEVTP